MQGSVVKDSMIVGVEGVAYKTLVVDPPWTPTMSLINGPKDGKGASKASPQRRYKTMSLEDIINIRPNTDKQAHMYLWVLSQHVDWGYEVAREWGFEPLTMLTWCKPGLGAGRFQCNTEHVLVCRKGSRHGNPFGMTGGTYFDWPRGKHSEKPEDFYTLVDKCSPLTPRLDMYARLRREGWDSFGDEL